MILDSLANSPLYYSLNPRLERAFAYIASTDFEALEPGKHLVDGEDIFVNIMDVDLKEPQDAKLEVHNSYLDIQVVIRGERESFGWSPRADVKLPLADFDAEKDVQLFDDVHQTRYTILPGQFSILLPEDAHAPMIGHGHVLKIIVKVRM